MVEGSAEDSDSEMEEDPYRDEIPSSLPHTKDSLDTVTKPQSITRDLRERLNAHHEDEDRLFVKSTRMTMRDHMVLIKRSLTSGSKDKEPRSTVWWRRQNIFIIYTLCGYLFSSKRNLISPRLLIFWTRKEGILPVHISRYTSTTREKNCWVTLLHTL